MSSHRLTDEVRALRERIVKRYLPDLSCYLTRTQGRALCPGRCNAR
jgi:hypothetical protein